MQLSLRYNKTYEQGTLHRSSYLYLSTKEDFRILSWHKRNMIPCLRSHFWKSSCAHVCWQKDNFLKRSPNGTLVLCFQIFVFEYYFLSWWTAKPGKMHSPLCGLRCWLYLQSASPPTLEGSWKHGWKSHDMKNHFINNKEMDFTKSCIVEVSVKGEITQNQELLVPPARAFFDVFF